MLRTRANWRNIMDEILKEKGISIEIILDINEKLYDTEVRELVSWLLDKNNTWSNVKDIYKQIGILRR